MTTNTMTKAQASKLLTAPEMKLFEESRVRAIRVFAASQLDRRVLRMRELRDKARDQLQRQRVALQSATGSRRGAGGTANQQRSKDKVALLTDMLRRFEAQLKVARKAEAAGNPPAGAPARRVTRKAAKSKVVAPGKDFTAHRMRTRNTLEEEAGRTLKARKTARKATAASPAAAKKASTTRTANGASVKPAAKNTTSVTAKTVATKRPKQPALDAGTGVAGPTAGKRTASLRALDKAGQGNGHVGFADASAHNRAQQRKFDSALLRPIQARISARDRRTQARRDSR